MTQKRIIIATVAFQQAALDRLLGELAAAGVTNIDTRHARFNTLAGNYEGDLEPLKKLDNVDFVDWEGGEFRLAPLHPRIPQ